MNWDGARRQQRSPCRRRQTDKEERNLEITEDQKRIAFNCIADVVKDAATNREKPSAEELKKLAEGVADAVVAGFKKINEAN